MQKYKRVTVDFITNEMVSNTGLAQHYFALLKNEKIGKKALGCFVRDPLQAVESMIKERENLSELASKTLTWLSDFLEESLLFSCNKTFDAPLVQSITEEPRHARADDCVLTWSLVKELIRKQLVDLSGHAGLESLQAMRRSSGTHCIQWTSTSILLYGLIKETSKTVLGPVFRYNY